MNQSICHRSRSFVRLLPPRFQFTRSVISFLSIAEKGLALLSPNHVRLSREASCETVSSLANARCVLLLFSDLCPSSQTTLTERSDCDRDQSQSSVQHQSTTSRRAARPVLAISIAASAFTLSQLRVYSSWTRIGSIQRAHNRTCAVV